MSLRPLPKWVTDLGKLFSAHAGEYLRVNDAGTGVNTDNRIIVLEYEAGTETPTGDKYEIVRTSDGQVGWRKIT